MDNVPDRLVVEEDVDRWPVIVGALCTMVFLTITYLLPPLIPYPAIEEWLHSLTGQWYSDLDEPFEALRFFGGFVGGVVAGYLTPGRSTRATARGGVAAVLGVALVYAVYVSYNLIDVLLSEGANSLPLLSIFIVPFIFLFVQIGPVYLAEGLVFGWIGGWLAD